MVPQVEILYVVIPFWVRALNPERGHTHWLLKRCLPGQRNAALRWRNYFNGLCTAAGLTSYPGSPTVLKHENIDRKIFVNVHVDDILLICKPEDVPWFTKNICSGLKLKIDGPHKLHSGSQLMYLKKNITMHPSGILLQPNRTYIPKMICLLKLSGRRKKGLPYHATLEAYAPELVTADEMLDQEQAKVFKSGLGLALYVAGDSQTSSLQSRCSPPT